MSVGRKQYPFDLIEPKWQAVWDRQQTFRAWNPGETVPPEHPFARRHQELPPKYYVLDMFPYPSGAGLHVGHPEGYTATDILARYRRAAGFNVLHPMGWDAFGLPAEQYAVKTGQHPRQTTEANIATFKRQIKSLGFSYDWSREVDTTDPKYFKWTQWIFLKLYNSYYDPSLGKAMPIEFLEDALAEDPQRKPEWTNNAYLEGIRELHVTLDTPEARETNRREFIAYKRLAYVAEAPVNWCPELGTVLANEEVIDGKSEVGGFPVVRKPMRQWMLRITAYAERLLDDLKTIDWSHSLKEMQRNWIARSEGAEVQFEISNFKFRITVFTTRPDTLFGATYMVLSPEHKLVDQITTAEQRDTIAKYKSEVATKSDLERTELAKDKSGVFTGAYAINPVNHERIPIWIADYVLATYGTGAIMAVPAHDERDWEFAKKYSLPIVEVVWNPEVLAKLRTASHGAIPIPLESPFCGEGTARSSPPHGWGLHHKQGEPRFEPPDINSLPTAEAKKKITGWLEEKGLGRMTINYKLRDWLFSRQRYWGEPFPIVWRDGQHEALPESALPVMPPELTDYKPTASGEPPLARAKAWVNLPDGARRETNTMPQWAGSCWYYLRYLDAQNSAAFTGGEAERYWMGTESFKGSASAKAMADKQVSSSKTDNSSLITDHSKPTPGVDLYVGGTEHAVLHLLYARFWHKVLFDLGYVSTAEPFYKLVNQGLILGEDGQKMSKSRGNVVNPDDILAEYGADAFRLYEMFLGPLEMVKPWSTKNVEGVYRFLGKVWRLFVDEQSETEFEQKLTTQTQGGPELLEQIQLSATIKSQAASPAQLKALHACIKKVTEDLDGLRFNTAISALMVFINDAMKWDVKPASVLRDFLILLQPFAPHLAEELFAKLGVVLNEREPTLAYQPWPKYDPGLLVESTLEIPIQVNGKLRDLIIVPSDATAPQLETAALASEKIKLFTDGKTIKKIIVLPRKLVNIVIGN